MNSLLAAVALAAPTVDVPGIGVVPLADAVATCVDERPVGAVAAAAPSRAPAFSAFARPLLDATEQRQAVFGEDWPRTALDLDYVGSDLQWLPPGVTASCWAAGRAFVALGLEIRAACDGKEGCKDRFAAEEQDMIKEAIKGKVKDRKDAAFASLAGIKGLRTWQSPRPLLDKACALPVQAAGRGWHFDVADLDAARASCGQLLVLIRGDAAADLATVPCGGAALPVGVLPSPLTDLGVTDVHVDVQVATILDKLTRMDTGLGACDAPTRGSVWRGDTLARWRASQTSSACVDNALALADRLTLCPDLQRRATAACTARDHVACDLLARLYVEGVGVDADERRALETWQISCNAAHAPACAAIAERRPAIDAWWDEALDAADGVPPGTEVQPDPFVTAHMLLAQFGAGLGAAWIRERSPALFDAALAGEQVKHARDVILLYGVSLGETWAADARDRLAKLEEAIAKRKK